METPNLKRIERSSVETFSNLSPKVNDILLDFITSEMSLDEFLKSLEGLPGHDNFYKRLRTGTKVKVLRSSGDIDASGWIIDPGINRRELESGEGMIAVHNKDKHIQKFIPLKILISWNIET